MMRLFFVPYSHPELVSAPVLLNCFLSLSKDRIYINGC